MGIITALKLPLKLLAGLVRKKPKKVKDELEEKQLKHIRNFDPTRLKNRSWQKSFGKSKRRKKRKIKANFRKRKN